jgi:hypothetical protein
MDPESYLKTFSNSVQIIGVFQILKLFCGVSDPLEQKKHFKIGGSLIMNPWVVLFIHADEF